MPHISYLNPWNLDQRDEPKTSGFENQCGLCPGETQSYRKWRFALKRAPMWTQLSQDPGRVKAEVCEMPRPCGKDIDLLTLR